MQYCDLSSMISGILQHSDDLDTVVVFYDYSGIVMLYIVCSLGREPTEIWGSRTSPTG